MGFDISFHPISETEMYEWYFEAMGKLDTPAEKTMLKAARRHGVNGFYSRKLVATLQAGLKTPLKEIFDKSHGFYLAVVQGFYRTFYYTRDTAFSFLTVKKPEYLGYTKPWQDILGEKLVNPVKNGIFENYCSGVYLPHESTCRLLEDYADNEKVHLDLESEFTYGSIDIFLQALSAAASQGLGLLEASEVIEPCAASPLQSASYSNLYHCHDAGLQLYYDAVAKQIEDLIR